jgi:hypothetical protein
VTRRRSAARAEEEAELRALSERADQHRSAVGDTVQALAEKTADGSDVHALARRGAALLASDVRHAAREASHRPGAAAHAMWARGVHALRRPAFPRMAVIAMPTALLIAAVTWQVRRRTH